MCVVGLGHVGSRVAKLCARAGARLTVADLDPGKRALAEQLGAAWLAPARALETEAEVLVPCALGGFLNHETVPRLRCRVIAGAANNQLADDGVAELLEAQGILWAPDFVVNAGGLINISEELDGYHVASARRRVRGIADTLREIFARAERAHTTALSAAMALARQRLAAADGRPAEGRSPA